MNKQLLKDLAELEAGQVITAETAHDIKRYYQEKELHSPNRLGMILGVLGAVLIGSGLILIIAHNWDELDKLTKTIIALAPLLAAQLLVVYTLRKQSDSKTWRECSAVLLFFAIATCISLLSQIYQHTGTLTGFLLTWTLLALPLVYVLSSSVVALLCMATATWYAVLLGYFDGPGSIPYLYLVMMLFMAPHYYLTVTQHPKSKLLFFMNLFLCISIAAVLGSFLKFDDDFYSWYFAVYLLLFSIYYYTAKLLQINKPDINERPFYLSGITGILIILFMWSFRWLWDELERQELQQVIYTPFPYVVAVGTLIVFFLVSKTKHYLREPGRQAIGMSFIIFLLSTGLLFRHTSVGILAINIWIVLLAIIYIRKGSRENDLGVLNFGLVLLGILAVCRFFDESMPFVWRGIFFLITGCAFFILNFLLLTRRKILGKT